MMWLLITIECMPMSGMCVAVQSTLNTVCCAEGLHFSARLVMHAYMYMYIYTECHYRMRSSTSFESMERGCMWPHMHKITYKLFQPGGNKFQSRKLPLTGLKTVSAYFISKPVKAYTIWTLKSTYQRVR